MNRCSQCGLEWTPPPEQCPKCHNDRISTATFTAPETVVDIRRDDGQVAIQDRELDKIQAYIDSTPFIGKKSYSAIWQFAVVDIIIVVSIVLLDDTSVMLPWLLLPLSGSVIIAAIYLSLQDDMKKFKANNALYIGYNFLVMSSALAVAAYRVMDNVLMVPQYTYLFVIIVYLADIALSFSHKLKLIKQGFYQEKHPIGSNYGGKAILFLLLPLQFLIGHMNAMDKERFLWVLLSFALLLFSFLFLQGTQYLLTYVLLRKVDIE